MSDCQSPGLAPFARAMMALGIAATLCGCVSSRHAKRVLRTSAAQEDIYHRAGVEFTNLMLFKPLDTGPADALGFSPLIFQEMTAESLQRWSLNSIQASTSNGIPSFAGTVTTIYFRRTRSIVRGHPYDQVVYLWDYPDWVPQQTGPGLQLQAIRITMDSAGQPAIWEIAADSSGTDILFVSYSIERAATEDEGAPLPGRHFSIERDLRDAPRTVIAGIVDNTPVPMGPMVYIRAATRDINTISCRCNPAPMQNLIAQAYYVLREAPDTNMSSLLASSAPGSRVRSWMEERSGEEPLERRLRLPRKF